MMPADLVIIKFGGSLITNKSELCSPKKSIIDKMSHMASEIINSGKKLIIVHGAGSFGHIKSKKWKLSEGVNLEEPLDQSLGLKEVRRDMEKLNSLVVSSLRKNSIDAVPYSPHKNGKGIGNNYVFSTIFDEILDLNKTPVLYGDVVDTNCEKKFGILSGDDICEVLTMRLKPSHVIFAIDGADGIVDNPDLPGGGNVISKYYIGVKVITTIVPNDVTGGMELKIKRASNCVKLGSRVSIINGNNTEMIINAVNGSKYIGTELIMDLD
jgi:isopentenyl phosphate kinase